MVEKIRAYQFSKRFKKEYNRLPKKIQKAFNEKLTLFLKEISHPLSKLSESREQRIGGRDLLP